MKYIIYYFISETAAAALVDRNSQKKLLFMIYEKWWKCNEGNNECQKVFENETLPIAHLGALGTSDASERSEREMLAKRFFQDPFSICSAVVWLIGAQVQLFVVRVTHLEAFRVGMRAESFN